jgi:hypothetical protein
MCAEFPPRVFPVSSEEVLRFLGRNTRNPYRDCLDPLQEVTHFFRRSQLNPYSDSLNPYEEISAQPGRGGCRVRGPDLAIIANNF